MSFLLAKPHPLRNQEGLYHKVKTVLSSVGLKTLESEKLPRNLYENPWLTTKSYHWFCN